MNPNEIHVNPSRDGYHTGWVGDADEVAVFLESGDHIATLVPASNTQGWVFSETPGFAPGVLDTDVVLSDEDAIRDHLAKAMS